MKLTSRFRKAAVVNFATSAIRFILVHVYTHDLLYRRGFFLLFTSLSGFVSIGAGHGRCSSLRYAFNNTHRISTCRSGNLLLSPPPTANVALLLQRLTPFYQVNRLPPLLAPSLPVRLKTGEATPNASACPTSLPIRDKRKSHKSHGGDR